jgi:hypothetical protein
MFARIRNANQSTLFSIALGTGLALGSVIAQADSPHFIKATGTLNTTTGTWSCSWKEAGLGDNEQISYTCSGDATVTYVCVNKGGSNPSAQNKETVSGPVSSSGTFSSGKNGSITASLTLTPPGPGSFSCPNGQRLDIAQVSYTNVLLTDNTNGIQAPLAGTFSTGCLLPEVRGAC